MFDLPVFRTSGLVVAYPYVGPQARLVTQLDEQ